MGMGEEQKPRNQKARNLSKKGREREPCSKKRNKARGKQDSNGKNAKTVACMPLKPHVLLPTKSSSDEPTSVNPVMLSKREN
ncbi:hypothetical protein V6N12_016565 [Hibiscus sabdariffa]|uniref:Uncharacterized protein n=1 Tax=Hibiscus sabdariffa TaxID=183260 RepID=A0ABR2CE02_9ROSI